MNMHFYLGQMPSYICLKFLCLKTQFSFTTLPSLSPGLTPHQKLLPLTLIYIRRPWKAGCTLSKQDACTEDIQVRPLWNEYLLISIACMEHAIYSNKDDLHTEATLASVYYYLSHVAKLKQLGQPDPLQHDKLHLPVQVNSCLQRKQMYSSIFDRIKQKL